MAAGRGKGTRATGGKAAAKPAPGSTRTRRKNRGYLEREGPSPMERVARARRIAAARAKPRPDPWATIAAREEINERTVRRIYDDYLTWERMRVDPTRVMLHTLELVEAQILELDDAIARAKEFNNVPAWVGAIRLQMEAMVGRIEVMRQAGLMPRSMRAFHAGHEAVELVDTLERVLRRYDVPPEAIAELRGALSGGELEPGADVVDGSAVPA